VFGAFLDIEGAFDMISHITIEAARRHGLQDTSCQKSLLKKKNLSEKKLGNWSV